ncbi:hypothetical protein VKT23_001230 [Stygiomarasmius scandens]|uniref:Uncharacterized protein n=1 Tax=Marasmiellus scandens TaxID=2682957 RepID=A0ABR1K6U3_9AGAR
MQRRRRRRRDAKQNPDPDPARLSSFGFAFGVCGVVEARRGLNFSVVPTVVWFIYAFTFYILCLHLRFFFSSLSFFSSTENAFQVPPAICLLVCLSPCASSWLSTLLHGSSLTPFQDQSRLETGT